MAGCVKLLTELESEPGFILRPDNERSGHGRVAVMMAVDGRGADRPVEIRYYQQVLPG